MSIALYAGSFDPFTFGHLSIVMAAADIFDTLIVVVSENPSKEYLFSSEERVALIKDVFSGFKELKGKAVVTSYDGYTVDAAKFMEASVLVRGIRDASDIEYEMNIAELNSALAPSIRTIFLPGNRSLSEVSSSGVKEKFKNGKDISFYCPPQIVRAMKNKEGV